MSENLTAIAKSLRDHVEACTRWHRIVFRTVLGAVGAICFILVSSVAAIIVFNIEKADQIKQTVVATEKASRSERQNDTKAILQAVSK